MLIFHPFLKLILTEAKSELFTACTSYFRLVLDIWLISSFWERHCYHTSVFYYPVSLDFSHKYHLHKHLPPTLIMLSSAPPR